MWRPILAGIGVAAYAVTMHRMLVLLRHPAAPGVQAVRLAYLASAGSAALAGAMWAPEPSRSAIEGLMTLGINPLGLLAAARMAAPDQRRTGVAAVARSWALVVVSLTGFAAFALVQGRGLGPLAALPLRH